MRNTIDLLLERHIKWGASEFDEAFDFKEIIKNKVAGIAVETFDGKAAEIALNFGNKRVSQYIQDEYKDEIHTALDDIMDEDNDYTVAVNNAIEIIDQLKDKLEMKPFIKSITDSLLEMMKAAILIYLDRNN